ncbi:MAG: ATP-binding protein [Clostridia bacterium]|nr:ATP-binding protein [Clostridia bacterium]
MFFDRIHELSALEALYSCPGSSIVIVYGRRRLGKTSLLNEFAKGKPALYYLATQESESENRRSFQQYVADFTGNTLLRSAAVDSWESLFSLIPASQPGRKSVIILDEFQYLGQNCPAFPSIMQRIWDNNLQGSNVMLILCGSPIHMMESQTLHYSSPLYGRRSAQIRLGPIPFANYGSFYPGASAPELLSLYSITGGVPAYAEIFQPRRDLFEMIAAHILSPTSFLYEGPNFLLSGEVREIGSYFSILKAIAAGEQKLGGIAARLGLAQSRLSQYLRTLANLGLVHRDVPVTESAPEKSKQGLYRLQDNFMRFWFRFVYPNSSLLESGQRQAVLDMIRREFVPGHLSWVYEDVCRAYVQEMFSSETRPLKLQKVGRWWNRHSEIDVVGIGEAAILFGECKYWSSQRVGLNILNDLRRKAAEVRLPDDGKEKYYALFAPGGFTDDLAQLAKEDSHILLSTGLPAASVSSANA